MQEEILFDTSGFNLPSTTIFLPKKTKLIYFWCSFHSRSKVCLRVFLSYADEGSIKEIRHALCGTVIKILMTCHRSLVFIKRDVLFEWCSTIFFILLLLFSYVCASFWLLYFFFFVFPEYERKERVRDYNIKVFHSI